MFVCVLFSVPLGAWLRLWFGRDPGSGVRRGRACRCEAVGGWPGQREDFGWVGRLDVVHHGSNPPSHPRHLRVSAVCQEHFPLKVNIASARCYGTLECQLGAEESYMWFGIVACEIASYREAEQAAGDIKSTRCTRVGRDRGHI